MHDATDPHAGRGTSRPTHAPRTSFVRGPIASRHPVAAIRPMKNPIVWWADLGGGPVLRNAMHGRG